MTEHEASKAVRKEFKRLTAREDPMPMINSIREGTFTPKFDAATLATSKLPLSEAQDIWRDFRDEEIALESIFISEIWQRYLKSHETWASKNLSPAEQTNVPEQIVWELKKGTFGLFSNAIDFWKDDRERRLASTLVTKDALDEGYQYYKNMVAFGARNSIGRYDDTPASWIERGMGTANSVIWGLVHLVPDLAERKGYTLTEDQIVEAIESAYGPLITVMMSINSEVATSLLEGVMHPEVDMDTFEPIFQKFRREFFDLVQEKDGYTLVFHHEKLKEIKGADGKPIIERSLTSKTQWCPVRNTEKDAGVDVMDAFFDLAMKDARKYYFSRLSTP